MLQLVELAVLQLHALSQDGYVQEFGLRGPKRDRGERYA